MSSPSPLAPFLERERAIEHQRQTLQLVEARRHAGVTWSGLSAPCPPARTEAELRQAAEAGLAFQRAWNAAPQGAFLTAVAAIQRACEAAHTASERARSGAARGLPSELAHCDAALHEVRVLALDLTRGLRAARRALRAARPA